MAEPRSIRTNNPGAMNYGTFAQRAGAIGSDGRLAIFPDMATGYAAQEKLLGTYETQHGLNTVRGIVNRWAPPNVDNNSTGPYTQFVASNLGVDPDQPLTPDLRPRLAEVMAHYEAGRPVPRASSPSPSPQAPAPAPQTPGATPMVQPATGWTPESADFAKKFGGRMMQQGMSTEPVGHWTQALARVLQSGSGAAWNQQGLEAEREGNAAVSGIYRDGLANGVPIKTLASQLMDPNKTNGFGMDEGKNIAKAVIAQEVKGPELTNEQRDYQYGLRNPGFAARQNELKKLQQPQTTIDMKGETAASQAVGKGAGEAAVALYKEAGSAGQQIQQLASLQARLERLKTGPTAPAVRTAAAWAKDLGVPAETLKLFGIPENFVGDANAFEAATAGMLVNKLGSGGFPSNNFSNADREFLEKTLPRLSSDPRGNRIMIEAAKRVEMSKIEKAREYQAWKSAPGNKDKSFFDFDIEYSQRVGNRFDDLVQESRQMLDAAGQGFMPQPTQPGQAPPVQNGGGAQIITQGRQLLQSGQIDMNAVMQSAERAIAAGMDREEVMRRVQELTGSAPAPAPAPAPQQPPQRRGTLNREVIRNG